MIKYFIVVSLVVIGWMLITNAVFQNMEDNAPIVVDRAEVSRW